MGSFEVTETLVGEMFKNSRVFPYSDLYQVPINVTAGWAASQLATGNQVLIYTAK